MATITMAPVCPFRILVLLSLLSPSGTFLMTTSQAQRPAASSPSLRHLDDVLSYPHTTHVRAELRQNTEQRPVNASAQQVTLGLLGSPAPLFSDNVRNERLKDIAARFRTILHHSPPNNSLGDSDNALKKYVRNQSRSLLKMRRRTDVRKTDVLENFSRDSRLPFQRTLEKQSQHSDVSIFNTPWLVSLNTHLDLYGRPELSFERTSKHVDKSVVQNKDFDPRTMPKSKLWISVMNLKEALQTVSTDNSKSTWLTRYDNSKDDDDDDDDTDSELISEPSTENAHVLKDPDTGYDISPGRSLPMASKQTWSWLRPSMHHTPRPPYYEPDRRTEEDDTEATVSERFRTPLEQDFISYSPDEHNPHQPYHGTDRRTVDEDSTPPALPVSKRFRVPLHKKVFVYGRDDRLRVFLPQMRKFPFSNIARLSTGCTGTLVTPRHVLTAAHCVHNGLGFRNNLEKLKIEIPDTMGFKDYYAQKITIPTGWLRENRSKGRGRQNGRRAVYDYAVVRLKLAVTGRTKFLPLAVPRPAVLQMDFHFLAFPQDDQQLWRSVCLASQHMALWDGNLILTRCDAAVGNSGAAVFIQDPNHGGLRVVGILSNTMHVSHHRSFFRYSIITALTWPKLTDICNELGPLGRKYNVCPPVRYMRRTPYPPRIKVIPFFGKRSVGVGSSSSGGGAAAGGGTGVALGPWNPHNTETETEAETEMGTTLLL